VADERETLLLSLLRRKTVAFAMLPHSALVTSETMLAVVKVFSVLAALCTVEIPSTILFLDLFEFLLGLRLLGLHLAF